MIQICHLYELVFANFNPEKAGGQFGTRCGLSKIVFSRCILTLTFREISLKFFNSFKIYFYSVLTILIDFWEFDVSV